MYSLSHMNDHHSDQNGTQHHEEAAYWRDRPFPLYEDILALIEGRTATGDHAIHMPELFSSPPPDERILGQKEDEMYSEESDIENDRSKVSVMRL